MSCALRHRCLGGKYPLSTLWIRHWFRPSSLSLFFQSIAVAETRDEKQSKEEAEFAPYTEDIMARMIGLNNVGDSCGLLRRYVRAHTHTHSTHARISRLRKSKGEVYCCRIIIFSIVCIAYEMPISFAKICLNLNKLKRLFAHRERRVHCQIETKGNQPRVFPTVRTTRVLRSRVFTSILE